MGRWAQSSSGARGLPYRNPACACTAARRDELEGTRSLPCLTLPCCRHCGSVDWGGEGTKGASAIGSEELPSRRRPQPEGGAFGACPLLT